MPPTLVSVAVGLLLGAALLGAAYDRRSIAVVALAAALPDADAVASLAIEGATNALLHNLWLPGVAALALYWDTAVREESRLAARWGRYGIRVAWVALAAVVVAGIGPDLFSEEGANLLYPVHDAFYSGDGWLSLSTQEGVVQAYVDPNRDSAVGLRTLGTTADHHVASWINPTPGTGIEGGVERRIRIVEAGWQAVVVAAAAVATAARLREVE